MRIQYQTDGGHVPGLRKRLDIDTGKRTITIGIADRIIGTDELPVEESDELERLIKVADFFELPATSPPPPGAADYQSYTISVTAPDHSHEVHLTDPIENPSVRELVNHLNHRWTTMIDARLTSRRRDTS
jgi:hypothetical protein